MLTLYKNDASPPARAVMIVADILGIEYVSHLINPLLREQDTDDITKINPMRTIPYLEDNGFSLADSHAMMIYLVEKYGCEKHNYLYPKDVKVRATINQRLFFDCGILFPRLRTVMALTYTGRLTNLSKSMISNIEDAYRVLEAYLSENLYMADSVITLADISIFTTMSTLNGLHPINHKRYPKLMKWYNSMSEQEYSKRINAPGAADHVAGLTAFMEHNRNNPKSKL